MGERKGKGSSFFKSLWCVLFLSLWCFQVSTVATKKEEEGGEEKEEKEKETSWGGGSGKCQILITVIGSLSFFLNLQGSGTNEGLCVVGEAHDKKGPGGLEFFFH
jgi:hypothetical protein